MRTRVTVLSGSSLGVAPVVAGAAATAAAARGALGARLVVVRGAGLGVLVVRAPGRPRRSRCPLVLGVAGLGVAGLAATAAAATAAAAGTATLALEVADSSGSCSSSSVGRPRRPPRSGSRRRALLGGRLDLVGGLGVQLVGRLVDRSSTADRLAARALATGPLATCGPLGGRVARLGDASASAASGAAAATSACSDASGPASAAGLRLRGLAGTPHDLRLGRVRRLEEQRGDGGGARRLGGGLGRVVEVGGRGACGASRRRLGGASRAGRLGGRVSAGRGGGLLGRTPRAGLPRGGLLHGRRFGGGRLGGRGLRRRGALGRRWRRAPRPGRRRRRRRGRRRPSWSSSWRVPASPRPSWPGPCGGSRGLGRLRRGPRSRRRCSLLPECRRAWCVLLGPVHDGGPGVSDAGTRRLRVDGAKPSVAATPSAVRHWPACSSPAAVAGPSHRDCCGSLSPIHVPRRGLATTYHHCAGPEELGENVVGSTPDGKPSSRQPWRVSHTDRETLL